MGHADPRQRPGSHQICRNTLMTVVSTSARSAGFVDQSDVAIVSLVDDGGPVGVTVDEEEEPVAEEIHLEDGIVRSHRCQIEALRLHDLGKCLVLDRAQQALHAQQHLAVDRASEADYAEERPTLVMVVDDSITVRKVTTRLLERNGMEVVTAKDGVDAIAKLQDITPDIMLQDIEMPRMDGLDFLERLMRLRPMPVLMVSSLTERGSEITMRALELGAADGADRRAVAEAKLLLDMLGDDPEPIELWSL